MKQWIGILLAFVGTIIVLGFDIGISIPILGVIFSFIFTAVTSATIVQCSRRLPLVVSNFYQALGATIFLFLVMILSENLSNI